MRDLRKTVELYTEQEAADLLGITLGRLHKLVDEHFFDDGSERPAELTFTNSELVLLDFWRHSESNPKVIRMPWRR
jgi:hypothetical protein